MTWAVVMRPMFFRKNLIKNSIYLTPRNGIFLQKRCIYNKMNNQNKKIDNEIYYNNTLEFISLAASDGGKSD